jgi:monoamine oxidase
MPSIKTIDLSNTSYAYYAAATVTPAGTRLLHISGQPGNTKDGYVPADYESQIHLALLNLHKIAITAGASIKDIAKLTLLIVNYNPAQRKHAPLVERFLGGHRPAITIIPISQLAVSSWLFEIDAVLALSEPKPIPQRPVGEIPQAIADVLVIGAGLAGLSAAEATLNAGLSTLVLEARDRVGGKTWSTPVSSGDGVVDIGAAWINDTNQSSAYALAKRVGAELIEQNTTGMVVAQHFDGSCSNFQYGDLPKVSHSLLHIRCSLLDEALTNEWP